MSLIYVFSDKGLPGACKIGTSSTLESRYRQARSHTPRGITAEAFFDLGSSDAARAAEAAAKRALSAFRRLGDATEWFDLEPGLAIDHLLALPEFATARLRKEAPKLKPSDRLYDDWREARPQFQDYKWRLFLFEEQSAERRLKLSYGVLYETAYRYVFTYNPYPVRVIAGFEDPGAPEQQSHANRSVNLRMVTAWESVQEEVGSLVAEEVGWLKQGVSAALVAVLLSRHGFLPFDLFRPKPLGALARESSMNPPISYGGALPRARVGPSPEIYR